MIQKCPWCSKPHDSENHDVDWYFVCCATTRIVWRQRENGTLELEAVEEDFNTGEE